MSRYSICSTALALIRETFKIKPSDYTDFDDYKQDFEMRMEHAKELLEIWNYSEDAEDDYSDDEEDAESVYSDDDYDEEIDSDSESVCGRIEEEDDDSDNESVSGGRNA